MVAQSVWGVILRRKAKVGPVINQKKVGMTINNSYTVIKYKITESISYFVDSPK